MEETIENKYTHNRVNLYIGPDLVDRYKALKETLLDEESSISALFQEVIINECRKRGI